jgi:putative molybdopterin biosynthesis protein
MGLASDEIRGYSREEYSHLAVAVAAVKGGSADTGLGIMSAARALEVDFIPLFKERYDLVVPRAFFDSDLLRPLRELMEDPTSAKK